MGEDADKAYGRLYDSTDSIIEWASTLKYAIDDLGDATDLIDLLWSIEEEIVAMRKDIDIVRKEQEDNDSDG